ncbi:MAG: hypothetical protein V4631_18620 [Pseudomonadota bacterium]
MAKQAAIREVKSMAMSCDPVGNLLLVKFSFGSGKDGAAFMPAHIVFWLLKNIPVNQDPNLQPPAAPLPQITQRDWDEDSTPRINTMQCKQFQDAIRMTLQFENGPDALLLLDRSNVELMRQFMENYRPNLMDLGVF